MILYNEFDPKAAAWLRELVKTRLIPEGKVDERSISAITKAPETSHFFAGIGGWPLALDLAGWPMELPVWTGSCPCQPFSSAGKKKAEADERHLWPEFLRLITKCRPSTIFGEQVASPLGRKWLARVRADLEALGYAVGAADLCAAGVGAPHIRQRLYWVAYLPGNRWEQGTENNAGCGERIEEERKPGRIAKRSDVGRMGESAQFRDGTETLSGSDCKGQTERRLSECRGSSSSVLVGDPLSERFEVSQERHCASKEQEESQQRADFDRSNFWSEFDIVYCYDGKTRRIESGTFPLADGVPGRVGLLRGYGNAIVPQVAAVFVRSFMEVVGL